MPWHYTAAAAAAQLERGFLQRYGAAGDRERWRGCVQPGTQGKRCGDGGSHRASRALHGSGHNNIDQRQRVRLGECMVGIDFRLPCMGGRLLLLGAHNRRDT